MVLSAVVQHPKGKPCIDEWGERIQAFVGCAKAAGGDAKMAGYFVFLVDVPTEDVYKALIKLGAKTESALQHGGGPQAQRAEADDQTGRLPPGRPGRHFRLLEGRRPLGRAGLPGFRTERVVVEGKAVEKPWTPSFVFHGSGAIHKSGTGCIACPCDCAGGIIARQPLPAVQPQAAGPLRHEQGPEGRDPGLRPHPSDHQPQLTGGR